MTEKEAQQSAIPVIDMGVKDQKEVADAILKAFCEVGFATLINHGIDSELIQNTFAKSKEFFDLDVETKLKRKYESPEANRGYIPYAAETLGSGSPDKKETFDIGNEWETTYRNNWPTDELGDGFRETMTRYFTELDALHLRIMKLLGVALQMPDPDFFVTRCNEQHENLRLLHYPAVVRKDGEEGRLVQRGAVHTDYGTITLLCQDGVGGLRAQMLDGTWVTVPPVKNSIAVNVGDMFQRWSNDLLRATPHQVVELPSHSSLEMVPERYSIAMFCNANKGVMLDCLKECMKETNSVSRYEPVNAHDYITMRLSQTIAT